MIQENALLVALGAFLFLASFIVVAFLLYHLHLISQGTTTNESFKYSDLKLMFERYGYLIQGRTNEDAIVEKGQFLKHDVIDARRIEDFSKIPGNVYKNTLLRSFYDIIFPGRLLRNRTTKKKSK
jgi:hypothetical protein